MVLLPLVAGVMLPPLAARRSRTAAAWTAAAVTAASLVVLLSQAGPVLRGGAVAARWAWLPELGLELSLRLDGLALLFAVLILAIGLLIILYARYYLDAADPIGKFYAQLMLFMAAMLGIVLADNLLLLVFAWELTSISSFLLIGYWDHRADARQGARMALAVTGGGGLAMLAGFLLLGHIGGTYEISELARLHDPVHEHPLYLAALVLVLLGAFTKSAQFPLHFWLPEAMAAPTPVSAYLHSATMVKAGVFLLMRLYPVLGGGIEFEYIVTGVGLATLVFAAYVAIFKHDLKGLLAYSTISHLGLIVFLIGLDSPLSTVAAVFHVVNHATFKASLFMAAGIIDHECGSRDMRKLNGLWRFMPYTATLAMIAAAAMAGVPLLNGFLSKEMFFAEALEVEQLRLLGAVAPYAAALGGIFSVAYSARFVHDVFFHGEPHDLPRTPHEPPRFMRLPVLVLVALCVAVGLAPAFTVEAIVRIAAEDSYGGPMPPYTIALWHGFNLPLLMSAVALGGGILMYWLLQHQYNLHLHAPSGWTLRLLFQHTHDRGIALARAATARLANGSLQRYLALLAAAALATGAAPFLAGGRPAAAAPAYAQADALALALWLILAAAALGTVAAHRHRVVAVVLAAVVGLVVSLAFVYFSAPDLALTQLSVEVVTTVLLLMALALLPQTSPAESTRSRRLRDAALALAAGTGVAALAHAVLTRERGDSIAWYFLEKSVPEGGGSNAVNVILVDFRGFDTLGEITVLGIAALGAAALLADLRVTRSAPLDPPLLLTTAARALLPLAVLVSVYIFLRGHNEPGGGFIAGLVTAIALVIQYMALGQADAEARLRARYDRTIGAGLLVAAGTGMAAWLFGAPFLTSAYGHPVLPLIGEVPLASAAAFDLGVYLTVVGATLLAIAAVGHVTRGPGAAPPPDAQGA
ncbi:MAG: monovalent cation/H+ antiporter subunit A [Burkholderiales bacterium]|nr:monovalent cation/H+ antiporter subunit A [Burkholderiales bacterium]